ncbi:hypothetical protein [Herbiconiux daphne]|uniref:Uncharacterized protein n=1 Tax=Herbiconiux daphne TaxID=2970914 RepID=A0ABT2HAH0_9MICO|nr:hypothetical protein [Herbiconiux daphne]MCS5736940.1 hypothetical protein [Herbiconiux daphne]
MTQEANPVVPVATVDDFARLIADWHADGITQLEYVENVPGDVIVKAVIDGVERALTGTERQVFLAGVSVVRSIFEKLPFETILAQVGSDDAQH